MGRREGGRGREGGIHTCEGIREEHMMGQGIG